MNDPKDIIPLYNVKMVGGRLAGQKDLDKPQRLTVTSSIARREGDDVYTKSGSHYKVMNWYQQEGTEQCN